MERRVIVSVGCAEGEKVVGRLGAGAAKELKFEVAVGCVQSDGHGCWTSWSVAEQNWLMVCNDADGGQVLGVWLVLLLGCGCAGRGFLV